MKLDLQITPVSNTSPYYEFPPFFYSDLLNQVKKKLGKIKKSNRSRSYTI